MNHCHELASKLENDMREVPRYDRATDHHAQLVGRDLQWLTFVTALAAASGLKCQAEDATET